MLKSLLNKLIEPKGLKESLNCSGEWTTGYELEISNEALKSEEEVREHLHKHYHREYMQMTNNEWDHYEIDYVKLIDSKPWKNTWQICLTFYKFKHPE